MITERQQELINIRLDRLKDQSWVHDIDPHERVIYIYNHQDDLIAANASKDLRYVLRRKNQYTAQYAIK